MAPLRRLGAVTCAIALSATGVLACSEGTCRADTVDDAVTADLVNLGLLQTEHRVAAQEVANSTATQHPTGAPYTVTEFDRQMARIARHIYSGTADPLLTWTRTQLVSKGNDFLGVYSDGSNRCAVAFSGTNDLRDWWSNIKGAINTETPSSLNVALHQGYYDELYEYLKLSGTQLFNWISPCSSITAVGHSRGGAIASIFAALVNANTGGTIRFPRKILFRSELNVPVAANIRISSLVTFGAPGPTPSGQLRNALSSSGVFEGARFYNFGDDKYDPVPSVVGFHPLVRSVRIRTSLAGAVTFEEFSATSNDARVQPPFKIVGKPDGDAQEHGMVTYIAKLQLR